MRPGTLKVKGTMSRAAAVAVAMKGSPLTVAQINKATTLVAAKPMVMNTYKLDLARGLIVRPFQQVA